MLFNRCQNKQSEAIHKRQKLAQFVEKNVKRRTRYIKKNYRTVGSWFGIGTYSMQGIKHVCECSTLPKRGTVVGKYNKKMNYKNMLNSDLTLEICIFFFFQEIKYKFKVAVLIEYIRSLSQCNIPVQVGRKRLIDAIIHGLRRMYTWLNLSQDSML